MDTAKHTYCLPLSFPSVFHRCSWLYTSVTTTSILLRFLLPQRHCAGMWWICAKSRGRQIATCLRCGMDLVSQRASVPSVIHLKAHTNLTIRVKYCFVLFQKDRSQCVETYFIFLYLERNCFFRNSSCKEISCVVICTVIYFWGAYLCNAN